MQATRIILSQEEQVLIDKAIQEFIEITPPFWEVSSVKHVWFYTSVVVNDKLTVEHIEATPSNGSYIFINSVVKIKGQTKRGVRNTSPLGFRGGLDYYKDTPLRRPSAKFFFGLYYKSIQKEKTA